MNPAEIPDTLRNFAAAAEQSPDPAKSVAELARLLAGLFDQALQQIAEERNEPQAPGAAPLDHDELAFPPVDKVDRTDAEIDADIAADRAFKASGMSLADWAALPDCDRAHHIAVHQQLAAKAAEAAA